MLSKRVACNVRSYEHGKWSSVLTFIAYGKSEDAMICWAIYSPEVWGESHKQGFGPDSFKGE